MTSIDQMVSAQPGLITQVTGALTHAIFCAATLSMYHYSDYCYTHLTRINQIEETLWKREAYKRLVATYRSRVCAYREDNERFADTLFKEEF